MPKACALLQRPGATVVMIKACKAWLQIRDQWIGWKGEKVENWGRARDGKLIYDNIQRQSEMMRRGKKE